MNTLSSLAMKQLPPNRAPIAAKIMLPEPGLYEWYAGI